MLAALEASYSLHRALQMIETLAGLFEEPDPGRCGLYARMASLEKFRTDAMLKAPHASANRRLLNVERGRGAPKASVFCRRHGIAE
ncbi:hypothetical protein MesoLjLb_76560 [Mesorhizobium sp. L-8-3]|nr:hypothetical protein MesoLjLb_76560 [Mesorhizobium sp. L-8-3]